ncbi:MAG TPA: hypothetical protein VMO78_00275 [Rhizomicrobium sp.]|nr:hypothetical protein [Rhizomicrobium sp.]
MGLPAERLADLEVKADEPARLTPRTLRAMPTKIFIRPEHVTEDLCARMKKGKAGPKIVPLPPRTPCWKGLGADSEERREPVSDINTWWIV